VRKIAKGNSSLRSGISTTVTAVIIIILVVAVGAGVYYYTASTVPGSTTTATSISIGTTTSISTVTKTPTQSPVTITVWETYAPSSSKASEFGAFNESLTAFKAAYPWITVNVQTHPFGSEQADFTTSSLANQAPDVIRVSNDWTGALVAEGFLTPVDQFANSTFFSQYFPASIADYQFRGHTWGLPENINGLALFYNKNLVKTLPTTTTQWVSMAQSLTKYDSSCKITQAGIVFNFAGGIGGGYWWWPFLQGFGGTVFDPTNPAKPTVNSSAAVASVAFLDSLATDVNPDSSAGCHGVMPAATGYGDADTLFQAGNAAFLINGPWDESAVNASLTKLSIPFGVAALPTVASTGKPLAPFIGSQGWEIASGKSAAETLASWQFISFITNYNSQKNLATLSGDLPSNAALAKDPAITANPYTVGFLAQAATSSPAVNTPEMGIVYSNIGTYLGNAEPTSNTSPVTQATIQAQLTQAEKVIIAAIGSAG
jgi:arabinogalactan oligomer/maltooligosaccharide transport system substrate-binding protein